MKVSKKTRQRRKSVAVLDADCRHKVFTRDGFCCIGPGKNGGECRELTTIQWAHVVSRRHKHLRWDTDNSMCLCAKHHLWWHHAPLEAVTWFRDKYPERAAKLLKLRHETVKVNVRELAQQVGD